MTQPAMVLNDDKNYFTVTYFDNNDPVKRATLESQWKRFNRYDPALGNTYQMLCRSTNPQLEVIVEHFLPTGFPTGRYRVETFIPGLHAKTTRAIFSVTHNVIQTYDQTNEDTSLAVVDMSSIRDVWHPLGEFDLNPSIHPSIGKVRQYDLSIEDPPVEISFGPVRWVPMFPSSGKRNRFDAPVGTIAERNSPFPTGRVAFGRYPIWVGAWFDVNPFLNWYTLGFHTGADLNLPGSSAADKGKEIYSIGDGNVTYAGRAGSWGNIVVIQHPDALVTLPDGRSRRQVVYSRYGHVDDRIQVRAGQSVKRGQLITYIGLPANQISGWHLHFDICYTGLLKSRPAHWPNMDTILALRWSNSYQEAKGFSGSQTSIMKEVINNYLDPLRFIQANHS